MLRNCFIAACAAFATQVNSIDIEALAMKETDVMEDDDIVGLSASDYMEQQNAGAGGLDLEDINVPAAGALIHGVESTVFKKEKPVKTTMVPPQVTKGTK